MVERHRGAAIHPRAAFLLQRTMEILRAAGIEEEVRDGSHAQFEPDGAIMSAETLAGREIAYHLPNVNEGVRDMSPCERLFVTQVGLEPMLRARAEALGADVRFGTELVEFAQDADGVTAVIRDRDTGATRDGARPLPRRRRRPAQPDPRRARDRDDRAAACSRRR